MPLRCSRASRRQADVSPQLRCVTEQERVEGAASVKAHVDGCGAAVVWRGGEVEVEDLLEGAQGLGCAAGQALEAAGQLGASGVAPGEERLIRQAAVQSRVNAVVSFRHMCHAPKYFLQIYRKDTNSSTNNN